MFWYALTFISTLQLNKEQAYEWSANKPDSPSKGRITSTLETHSIRFASTAHNHEMEILFF